MVRAGVAQPAVPPARAEVAQRFATLFVDGSVQQGCLLLSSHHLTTKWRHACLEGVDDPIMCLPEGRLQFSGKRDVPHGSVIIGVGVDAERFKIAFAGVGRNQRWLA